MGGSSLYNFIMGIGESKVMMWSSVATLLLGIPFAIILIPRFQIIGLIAASIIATRIGWLVQYTWVKRKTGLDVDWRSSAKIYICSLKKIIVGYLTLRLLQLSRLGRTNLRHSDILHDLLVALPLSRTLSGNDLVNFRGDGQNNGTIHPPF